MNSLSFSLTRASVFDRFRANAEQRPIVRFSPKCRSGICGDSDQDKRGFTIVETLIVLAVSGALFLSAVLLVAGRQNRVAFQEAVQDIQSVVQERINEIGAGYYPNRGNFRCDGTTGTLNISAGNSAQGSNTGCIFMGKVIEFGVQNTDPQQYATYTVAGLQKNTGTLASARPVAIAPGNTTNNAANYPDSSEFGSLHNGLTAIRMQYVVGAAKTNIGAVAFVSGLGQYNGTFLLSGAQQVSLVPVTGTGNAGTLSNNPRAIVDAINANLASSLVNPSGGVEICFQSGGTNQSGLMTIGSNGRNLSVKMDIKSSKDCT